MRLPSGTKVFIDSEFTSLTQRAQLISLGLVAESGETFYAEFTDFEEGRASDFVRDHVIPLLNFREKDVQFIRKEKQHWELKGDREFVTRHLRAYLAQFEKIVCWLDYGAYDWVLFCELFGGSFSLPKGVYYIPLDLSSLLHVKGEDPDLDRKAFFTQTLDPEFVPRRHHAMDDALILKELVAYFLG